MMILLLLQMFEKEEEVGTKVDGDGAEQFVDDIMQFLLEAKSQVVQYRQYSPGPVKVLEERGYHAACHSMILRNS